MNIIIVHGLAQPKRLSNGLATLRERLAKALNVPIASIPYYSWRQHTKLVTAIKAAYATREPSALIGHSFGAGAGAKAIATASRGRRWLHLITCDGVQPPGPKHELKVPKAVERLHVWYQRQNVAIVGSPVTWDPTSTSLMYIQQLYVRHSRCDEHPDFQDYVVRTLSVAG